MIIDEVIIHSFKYYLHNLIMLHFCFSIFSFPQQNVNIVVIFLVIWISHSEVAKYFILSIQNSQLAIAIQQMTSVVRKGLADVFETFSVGERKNKTQFAWSYILLYGLFLIGPKHVTILQLDYEKKVWVMIDVFVEVNRVE